MRIRPAALVLVVVLVSVPGTPRAQDAQTPSFRAGVEALPVDVAVVDDRGQPIRDLLAADFTVRIDGRARRVVSAQWIAAGVAAGAAAAPVVPEGFVSNESSPGGRLIVLAVDQPNIPFGEMRPLREALNNFIDRLSMSDRVAVVGFGQPSVSTPFVNDKVQLKQAIDRMPGQRQQPGGGTHEIPITGALAIDQGDEAALEQIAARDCPGQSEKVRAPCKQEIRAEAQAIAADARQAGATTLNGLRDMLTSLKAIDGPKTLMFVSQGFFADRERGDDSGRLNEVATLASAARVNIYSLRLENSSDVSTAKVGQTRLNQEDQLARRYGLETLTQAGGGALFNVTGNGSAVFDRLTSELSGYYLLGLDADARDRDGKPHPIRVDVSRNNVVVRAHRTMVAGDGAAASAARSPQQIVTAALGSPLPASSLPIRAIAFSFRGLEPAKLRLLIHAEIGSGYTSPQRLPVAYYVFDKNGKSVDGQLTNIRLTPAAAGVPSSLIFTGGASIDPGDYTLKIVVADGERVGSVEVPVHATLLDLGRLRLTELLAGGPVPPIDLVRPSVSARVSFGTVQGYLEAYGPDATTLQVRFDVAAEERGPAILSAEVQGRLVGEERVIFSQQLLVQALPPGLYRLRALISQGDSLVTTLGRAFEIGPPPGGLVAKNGAAAEMPAAAPGASLYLPIEQRDLQRPFDREAALKSDALAPFQVRVPPAGRAAFDEGIAHLQKRDYRDAEASFKKAVQPDADSAAALAYLGVTYAAAGRDTQASNVWRTAMAGADDVPQLYEWLADALMRLKSSGEARPILEEAIARFPDDARFARPLAMLYATFGKGLDAVRLLERSLAANPDDQAALFLAVEWIFNAHRGGAVVHDRAEDARLAHEYAARYVKSGGLNEPLVKQWLNYLDKEAP